jgi:hypothetical protein
MGRFLNYHIHNYSHLLLWRTSPSAQCCSKRIYMIFFSCHYLKKLICNIVKSVCNFNWCRRTLIMINGSILGVIRISQQKKAYNHLTGSQGVHPTFCWLWNSSCQPKHKVLFCLLPKNRLNTRGLLRRKNMNFDSYDCELCLLQKEERLRHLFFKSPFAKNCWNQIGILVPTWLKPESTKELHET